MYITIYTRNWLNGTYANDIREDVNRVILDTFPGAFNDGLLLTSLVYPCYLGPLSTPVRDKPEALLASRRIDR